MLAHLRIALSPAHLSRPWSVAYHRGIASSSVSRCPEKSADSNRNEDESRDEGKSEGVGHVSGVEVEAKRSWEDPEYETWLATEARKWKEPHKERNWLGKDVPFPLNPSFKPPTPLSDALLSRMWENFKEDPIRFSVRETARRYGISIARVEAIFRLKGLEDQWVKEDKQLQTGFLDGMERILGVEHDSQLRRHIFIETIEPSRKDVFEADAVDEAEEGQRHTKFERMGWEETEEGQDPVMPSALQDAREEGGQKAEARRDAKSDCKWLARPEGAGPWKVVRVREPFDEMEETRRANLQRLRFSTLFYKSRVSKEELLQLERGTSEPVALQSNVLIVPSGSAPGRPLIKFVDVGGKFLDMKDLARRAKAGERRKQLREKKKSRFARARAA